MKYTYTYKESDGSRHTGVIDAPNRDHVFMSLREKGIKAIKVVAADGSKDNGEIRGVHRRKVIMIGIGSAAVAALVAVFSVHAFLGSTERPGRTPADARELKPLARQVIAGDRDRIAAAHDCFTNRVEAFLARYAEPGRVVEPTPESEWPTKEAVDAVLHTPIYGYGDELTEQIELKRIVLWLKGELRRYLNGGGYLSGYIKALDNRQRSEVDERIKCENRLADLLATVQAAADTPREENCRKEAYEYWLKANAFLQSRGIYMLPLPKMLYDYQDSL